jgi:CubicO group peptidase (beta-lactamase class C family)
MGDLLQGSTMPDDDVPPADRAAEILDRYLDRAVPFGFSGSVLYAAGGEVRLARGYGFADRSTRTPNTSDTVFSLGSVTKSLTATTVLVLVEKDRLRLESSIGDLLPGVTGDHAAVTIEQLLSHTGGLSDGTGEDFDPGTRDEVLEAAFGTPLRFRPGSDYAYSNTGYSVLAAIIEETTGEPFETALHRLVLEPAGMAMTGYRLPRWDRARVAHYSVGDVDLGTHLDKVYPSWHVMGNGEMLSTVHDLYRLTRTLRAGDLLAEDTLESAWTPRRQDYGLGWSITDGPHGRSVGHDGASTNGVSARLRWYPDPDVVIAILCNRDYSGGFLVHAVAPQVERIAFGGEAPLPPASSDDPVTLAGTWVTNDGGRISIREDRYGAMASLSGQDLLDLTSGRVGDPVTRDLAQQTRDLVTSLLQGDETAILPHLEGDRDRAARYRAFATDRLGSETGVVALEGVVPAELSGGPAHAVQLSRPGPDADSTLRVYWRDGSLAGLGYGTRPLLDLPLVAIGPDRFALHHLALGITVTVTASGTDQLVLEGSTGALSCTRAARENAR